MLEATVTVFPCTTVDTTSLNPTISSLTRITIGGGHGDSILQHTPLAAAELLRQAPVLLPHKARRL